MSDKSLLPPTKKLRLCNSNLNNSHIEKRTQTPIVFEWDDDKILLFIIGYLRMNINMGIYDISTIVFKYIKNYFINYHINIKKYTYFNDKSVL